MSSSDDALSKAIYEAEHSGQAVTAQQVGAIIQKSHEHAQEVTYPNPAIKLLLELAGSMEAGVEKEMIIGAALECNSVLGKLDWASATENLHAAAHLVAPGGENDTAIANQFSSYISDLKLSPMGQFRMSLRASERTPEGSALHKMAVNKTLEVFGELAGDHKVTARTMLQQDKGNVLVSAMEREPVEAPPPASPVDTVQREEPLDKMPLPTMAIGPVTTN